MLKKILQNSKHVCKLIWTSTITKSRTLTTLQRNFSAESKNDVSALTTLKSIQPLNRVIIVGAGLSGLSAADYLIRNGIKDILILEAAERYGGRIHTIKFGDAICELGAKWINAKDTSDSMFRLAKQGGLIERNSFENGPESFFIINREPLDDEVVQLASIMFHDIIKSTEKYMTEEVPSDQRTANTYIKARMNKVLTRMTKIDARVTEDIFQTLLRNLSCQLGSDLGYIHVKQLANIARHLNNPIFIPSGLDQIFKQLVQNISTERLMLGKPVSKIHWADFDSNEGPHVVCMDGSKYYANHIICTIPLGALSVFSEVLFSPNLPENKKEAMKKLGKGSPGKIYLHYDEPVNTWFIGSVMLGSAQLGFFSSENWAAGISEIATPPGSRKVIEVKVGGSYNETAERISEDIVDRELAFALRKIMKNNRIPHPKEIVRSLWSTDARTLCGLPFISRESTESSIGDLAEPLGLNDRSNKLTLLFAGDATSFNGFGTLEAARSSGIREAKRILGITYGG